TSPGKIEKGFVNSRSRKNFSPLVRTSRDEINRRMDEHSVQSVEPRFAIFGAHRASLQVQPYCGDPRYGRSAGPTYSDRGRMRRLLSCCSVTCAHQPATRDAANSGVFNSGGKP